MKKRMKKNKKSRKIKRKIKVDGIGHLLMAMNQVKRKRKIKNRIIKFLKMINIYL